MDFCVKLQQLRKEKGMTQEQLAKELYVSRTAISKWESGRGYPSIDSLKIIAEYFGVTVDELLTGEEVLTIAQEDQKVRKDRICDLTFGLLDICVALFLFLPFLGQKTDSGVLAVSLLAFDAAAYVKASFLTSVALTVLFGVAKYEEPILAEVQKALFATFERVAGFAVYGKSPAKLRYNLLCDACDKSFDRLQKGMTRIVSS